MSEETKTTVGMTRTTIEKMLAPVISDAVSKGQVPEDYDHVRRVARALVHLAARQLLAAGATPQMVVGQIGEALSKELARANQQHPGAGGPIASA